jgi:hypothetical protein
MGFCACTDPAMKTVAQAANNAMPRRDQFMFLSLVSPRERLFQIFV